MGVSSTEKINTKGDLAIAMTKSRSKSQTVTNALVKKVMNHAVGKHSNIRDLIE